MRILLVGAGGVGTALARVNPVVALELIDSGAWSGTGVLGPEALPAGPFLDLITSYGPPWASQERTPAGA